MSTTQSETLEERKARIALEIRSIVQRRLELMRELQKVVSDFDANMLQTAVRWNQAKADLDNLIIQVTRPVEQQFAHHPSEWWKTPEADAPGTFLDDWLCMSMEAEEYERLTYEISAPPDNQADYLDGLPTEFKP